MSAEITIVLIVCFSAIVLFVTELLRADLVAFMVAITLVLFGIVPQNEIFLGLANPATLTVLSMFILSEGINRTGVIDRLGNHIYEITNQSLIKAMLLMMVFVGFISMFINNTAAVALLIPVVMNISKKAGWSPSKLLIPLSFASMFGGVCTLIGTSTNLLANSMLEEAGYKPFEMFSFTDKGLIFFAIGIVFLLIFSNKLIHSRRSSKGLTESFEMAKYLIDVQVLEGCSLIGERVEQEYRNEKIGLDIIAQIETSSSSYVIQQDDILRVRLDIEGLQEVLESENLQIVSKKSLSDEDFDSSFYTLVEAVVGPKSRLVGKRVGKSNIYKKYSAKLLALRHHSDISHNSLEGQKLDSGDTLLLSVKKDKLEALYESDDFILLSRPKLRDFDSKKTIPTLAILLGVVLFAKFSILPIHLSALIGVVAMVLFKVISLDDAYKAVDWKIIFLLAGLLTLGKSLEYSGTATWLSGHIVSQLGDQSHSMIIGVFFTVTMLLTAFMSNNASVVLMTPIAINLSQTLNMDVHNMVLAVMFASSMSFMTPVGYQTNMMIYGVGQFRFSDFLKIGGPLCLLFIFVATLVLS